MKNKKIFILFLFLLLITEPLFSQSYLLRFKWHEGDVYHYKLTVESPQFGSQEFYYDQIVEKIYTPTDASFTFKTPLGTFKAKSSDIRPLDGAAIVKIVYTKGFVNGKEIPVNKLIKNLLLYIKPNGETFILQRKKIQGIWEFELANVSDQNEKDELRRLFKSPVSVDYSISDNTTFAEYDPDGIFHPIYLPDQPVKLGEKMQFSSCGFNVDCSINRITNIGGFNCIELENKTRISTKEMMQGIPEIGGEIEMAEVPGMSEMMMEINQNATAYFEPNKGIMFCIIDHSEIKGPLNMIFDSRLDLVSAEISGEKIIIKSEIPEKKIEEKFVTETKETETEIIGKEEKEESPDYKLIRKRSESGETSIKILEPEGAIVSIKSELSEIPIHQAEIPTLKKGLKEGFYKIEIRRNGEIWVKKLEIKNRMEHILYVKSLLKEKMEEEKVIKPMSENSFSKLLESIKSESFEDTKIEILESAASDNYFTCEQLINILKLFSFEDNKIKACKIVYPKLVDKENFHSVYSSFTFSDSKKKIKDWIEKYEGEK